MSWWSDVVAAVESAAGGEQNVLASGGQTPAGPVTVPAGPLGGLTTAVTAIWTNLRDYKMWRSLGWLLLGVVLMLLGAASWIAGQKNPVSIARKVVT